MNRRSSKKFQEIESGYNVESYKKLQEILIKLLSGKLFNF